MRAPKTILIGLFCLCMSSCSTLQGTHARLTYDFEQDEMERRVFYEAGTEDAARVVSEQLNEAVKEIETAQFASFKEPSKIEVYLFDDKRRYSQYRYGTNAQSLGGSGKNQVYLPLPTIRARLASDLCQKEDCKETVEGILLHELSHVHLRQHLGNRRYVTDVPLWFSEGLATMVSDGAGAGRITEQDARMSIASGKHLLPHSSGAYLKRAETVGDLRPTSFAFYRQSLMFVTFLQERNPAGFQKIVKELIAGRKFETLWEPNYGEAVEELWDAFVLSL